MCQVFVLYLSLYHQTIKKHFTMKKSNLPPMKKWKEMWETHDIDVVKDLFHEQVSYSNPSSLTWVGGKENVVKYFDMVLEGFKTLNFWFDIDTNFEVLKRSKGYYSLLVHQIEDDLERKCLFELNILEDKIFCIEMEPIN